MKHLGELIPAPRPSRTDDPYAGGIMTNRGWFSHAELGSVQARNITNDDGERVIQFPIRYDSDGPFYAPLGLNGYADRMRIGREDAASEARRKMARNSLEGKNRLPPRRRRWEDDR